MNKKLLICFATLLTAVYCATAASYLESGVSARTDAMGRAFSAVADDLDAFYYNPAGYGFQDKLRTNTMFTKVNNLNSYYYLGAGNKFLNGYGAINLCMTSLDGIPESTYENVNGTMMPVETGNNFSYAANALFLSYAMGLKELWSGVAEDNIKLGVSAKYIGESLYKKSASGLGLDAGIMYKQEGLALGFSIINLLEPVMTWDTDSGQKNSVERTERLGVAYQVDEKLLLSADLFLKKNSQVFGLGLEYLVVEYCALRGGILSGGYSLGLGILYTDFNFDYAYIIPSDDLIDHTQKFSLGYVFNNLALVTKLPAPIPAVAVEAQPTIYAPVVIPTAQVAEQTKQLAEVLILQKKSVVLGDNKAKGFYVVRNSGSSDLTVKVNSMLIGPAGDVIGSMVKDNIFIGAQQELVIEQVIVSPITLKQGNYKVKTFMGTATETLTYVDSVVK